MVSIPPSHLHSPSLLISMSIILNHHISSHSPRLFHFTHTSILEHANGPPEILGSIPAPIPMPTSALGSGKIEDLDTHPKAHNDDSGNSDSGSSNTADFSSSASTGPADNTTSDSNTNININAASEPNTDINSDSTYGREPELCSVAVPIDKSIQTDLISCLAASLTSYSASPSTNGQGGGGQGGIGGQGQGGGGGVECRHEVIREPSDVITFSVFSAPSTTSNSTYPTSTYPSSSTNYSSNYTSTSTYPSSNNSTSTTIPPPSNPPNAPTDGPHFKYPPSLHLDRFLCSNFDLVAKKRGKEREMRAEVQGLVGRRRGLVWFEVSCLCSGLHP